MQKYKIVASKSQKKYTIILSADSENEAKEKLHKDNYSILSISKIDDSNISGNKFLFQIEQNGETKNGIIVGKDIFKVYVKLKDELGYKVLFLYPEGDEAHANAEKKQKIINELERGYNLHKKNVKVVKEQKIVHKIKGEENFYLKKQLDETYALIEKVLEKFTMLFSQREKYEINDEVYQKLQKVYEKMIHIKGSTNLNKLKEIGELSLVKIAEIELGSLEKRKDKESRDLLKGTNDLLKKIGSDKHFIEKDKDIKKIILNFFNTLQKSSSLNEIKKNYKTKKVKKDIIDTQSYGFLKTILLLEKYKEKLKYNSNEIQKNIILFLNPFNNTELKDTLLLKRKVIKQNISILKAKKTGKISSYTGIKKGYLKTLENFQQLFGYISSIIFVFICIYSLFFLSNLIFESFGMDILYLNAQVVKLFILFFILYFVFTLSRNLIMFGINIVFFCFIFIFSIVNF